MSLMGSNELTKFIKKREDFDAETLSLRLETEEILSWCQKHCRYLEERNEWLYKAISFLLLHIEGEDPLVTMDKLGKILEIIQEEYNE